MKRLLQLDFFGKLIALTRKPSPSSTPPVAAPPAVVAEHEFAPRVKALMAQVHLAELAGDIKVVWNPRMRSTAGLAYPRQLLICLNPRLREFGEAEIDRTLRHELAHLVAHLRAGRRRIAPHGPEWERACRDLGLVDEKRCHELPLPRRKMAPRYLYRCPVCHMELQRVRPLRGRSACLACCRKHNRGRYDDRFRFTRISPPPA